jgi:hypothetical protein
MTEADVLTRLLHAVDGLDWAGVRDALAGEVLVDYTSLSGGEPETLSADDLVARWRGLLPGFDATQHLTGPVLVTNDGGPGVRADTHVIGYHRLDGADHAQTKQAQTKQAQTKKAQTKQAQTWAVHGHYTARLVAGKITELTLTVFFVDGNLDLPRLATERAASGLGRDG